MVYVRTRAYLITVLKSDHFTSYLLDTFAHTDDLQEVAEVISSHTHDDARVVRIISNLFLKTQDEAKDYYYSYYYFFSQTI